MERLGWTNEERMEKRVNVKQALVLANKHEAIDAEMYNQEPIVYDLDSVGTMCDDELKAWGQFCKVNNLPY